MPLTQLTLTALIALGITLFVAAFGAWPTKAQQRNITTKEKRDAAVEMKAALAKPITKIVAKFLKLPEYKRRKLVSDLERAELKITPEQYYASAIARGVLISLVAIPALLIEQGLIALGCIAIGVLAIFEELKLVTKELRKKDEEITRALPHFVLTVNEMLKSTHDLKHIFEKYLHDVASTPLATDLRKLLAHVEANENMAEALQTFDRTLDVPLLSNFVSGLIEVTKGVDQSSYFQHAHDDMMKLNQEQIKRMAAKRPQKIKWTTFCMLICFILIFVAPVIMQLLNSMSIFRR